MNDKAKAWLSKLQSGHARNPRNRTTLARQSVKFVFERADFFPGALGFRDASRQSDMDHFRMQYTDRRGQQLRRFRHYVGAERRLYELGTIDVEVTTHYDERAKPVSYEFFCNETFRHEHIVDASLRKIVKEVSREMGQECK